MPALIIGDFQWLKKLWFGQWKLGFFEDCICIDLQVEKTNAVLQSAFPSGLFDRPVVTVCVPDRLGIWLQSLCFDVGFCDSDYERVGRRTSMNEWSKESSWNVDQRRGAVDAWY